MENRIRVSSREQKEPRQLQSMKIVGIYNRDVFIDKQSGKELNREQDKAREATLSQD